jgi:hypothetical protein
MRSILFNIKPEVSSADQDALLQRMNAIPGIHRASSLNARAKNASVRRMCFAEVQDDSDIHALLGQIQSMPEVEEAALPAQRGLPGRPPSPPRKGE